MDLLEADRRAQEGDAGADRACLPVGAEALDRPHTGNNQARLSEREIFKAADVERKGDDLNEIEKAGAAIKVDERYPPHLMATTGR